MKNNLAFCKIIAAGLIITFMCSCEKKQDIYIGLINKELHYLERDSVDTGTLKITYDSLDVLKARNIVTYHIRNETNRKTLFLANPYSMSLLANYPLPRDFSDFGMFYNITDKNNKSVRISTGDYQLKDWNFIKILKNEHDNRTLKKDLILDKKFVERQGLSHAFILNPNDDVFFSIELNLPIFKQPNLSNNLGYTDLLMFKGNYNFQIFYSFLESDIKKVFTEEEIKFLKTNDIVIFTGQLKSNTINVVPVR